MRRASLAALAVLLLVLEAGSALACRCARIELGGTPNVEKSLSEADFVFFGEVMSKHDDGDPYEDAWRSWEFDVAAVWKGDVSRRARVYAHSETGVISSCDREFEVGSTYVVFGYLEKGIDRPRFRTHLCSLTTRVELGEPRAQKIVGRLDELVERPPR